MISNVREQAARLVRRVVPLHRPCGKKSIFIIAMPRGGSTWLMELVASQPEMRHISEPFDFRNPRVREHLKLDSWNDLYRVGNAPTIRQYMLDLESNRVTFMNPVPFRRFFRLQTMRTVFKLIHACEDQLEWLAGEFGGVGIHLMRHPIAVSVSRKVRPRLDAFVSSDYSRFFTVEQLDEARRVVEEGDTLEQGVLSWCFQNSVPLRTKSPAIHVLTYEQLVCQPERMVPMVCNWLDLSGIDLALQQVRIPSTTANLTFKDSADQISSTAPKDLIRKWRSQVKPDEEARVMRLLEVFELDAYEVGSDTSSRYWY